MPGYCLRALLLCQAFIYAETDGVDQTLEPESQGRLAWLSW